MSGDEDIHKALEAGVAGYVLKDSTDEKLIPAIRAVAAGQRWIPRTWPSACLRGACSKT